MSASLKTSAAKGMAWISVEQISKQLIHFIIGIILARYLLPADYGIVPMLSLIYAICETIIDSGMSSALIRKKERTELDYSTLFYFNLCASIFFYCILFYFASVIARFFDMPILISVTRVTAINFVVSAFGTIQRTRLQILLNFKPTTIIDSSMLLLSGIGGIILAKIGYGVWALILPNLFFSTIGTILLWCVTRWVPICAFSWNAFREMFGFGSKILCSSIINTIYNNISTLVIGKMYSPTELGLYGRAQQFPAFPCGFVQGMILRITYPLLAKVNNETPERIEGIYKRVLRLPVYILAPILTGIICIAFPMIDCLLGERWRGCVILCQIYCFGAIWNPLTHINLNLLYVKGRSDLVLKLEFIKKTLGFTLLICSYKFGITGIVFSVSFYNFIAYSINCWYTGKFIGLGELQQLRLFLPIFINVTIMAVLTRLSMSITNSSMAKLLIGIPVGFFVYFLLSLIEKDTTYVEIIEMLHSTLKCPFLNRLKRVINEE